MDCACRADLSALTAIYTKPAIDDRDGADVVRSRIGLSETAVIIYSDTNVYSEFQKNPEFHAIIADECQFFSAEQIDQLRCIVDDFDVPVLCFGLRTDFKSYLFEGSRRLFEVADSISEIKTICSCGNKAIVNARIDSYGNVITEGGQILIGGNDSYVAMCHKCWKNAIKK